MEGRVQVAALLDVGVLGWVDKLLVAVWRGTSLQSAQAFYREMKSGIARHGTGVGHLAVIEPHTPLPSPETRQRIASVFDEHPQATAAVCVVFEGTGFVAAAVGSVATSIMFLSGRRTPFKVANTVVSGASFLGQHMQTPTTPWSSRTCVDAVELLRRRLHNRPSFWPDPG